MSTNHSKVNPTRNQPVMLTLLTRPPVSACAQNPLAGFDPGDANQPTGREHNGCCS